MWILTTLYSTLVDALFPLSAVEKELLGYTPERAYSALPPAPSVPLQNAFSVFAYKDERVAKLIWNIKYKKTAKAVELGGYALYQKLVELHVPSGSIVIPIPLSARRRRERGFNQCELLLDEVARLDVAGKFTIKKDLLIRTQHASRQTLKGREDRLQSAKGIFSALITAEQHQGRTLVIVDDVITTGSTLKEAMETVKIAGFKKVIGLSLAH